MKMKRLNRAGVLGLAVTGLLASAWVLPPVVHRVRRMCPVRPDGVREAAAYANFARRYGVGCEVCHTSVPQLNETGYKFRVAGYRMPDEIGSEAKWGNWGDNMSLRLQENYNVAATKGSTSSTPETNGFVNGGLELYPLEGAFGKYMAANGEVDFAAGKTPTTVVNNTAANSYNLGKGNAGQVSMTNMNMIATLPINADSFVTARTGLISAFQGYGASDRGVGLISPTFKPTPSQVQPGGTKSFTYPGFGSSGEGLELAYNWKGTHVSAQVVNGYNSNTGSTYQGEDNHLKDFGVFANQMIGENAIAAYFYNGSSGYSSNAATIVNGIGGAAGGSPFTANWYDNYMRGIVYGTLKLLPQDKLDLLLGGCDGYDHTFDKTANNATDTFHSMGWFATLQTVQKVMDLPLTTALSYGTNRASTATAGNRVSDVTLSFAMPIENNKFAFDVQTQRQQQVGTRDTIADLAEFQWQFMY
jgi:hypothetical protein